METINVTPTTDEAVIDELRQRQGVQSQARFAGVLGVSPSHLSDVYHKRKLPGKKILKYLGIRLRGRGEFIKYEADT